MGNKLTIFGWLSFCSIGLRALSTGSWQSG